MPRFGNTYSDIKVPQPQFWGEQVGFRETLPSFGDRYSDIGEPVLVLGFPNLGLGGTKSDLGAISQPWFGNTYSHVEGPQPWFGEIYLHLGGPQPQFWGIPSLV